MADDDELLERITINPDILFGKPTIRGNRLAVEHVLGMMAHGTTEAELLENYDFLEPEDIQACLLYAAKQLNDQFLQDRRLDAAE